MTYQLISSNIARKLFFLSQDFKSLSNKALTKYMYWVFTWLVFKKKKIKINSFLEKFQAIVER